jgi:ABC-type glutathione transport system ATPase component
MALLEVEGLSKAYAMPGAGLRDSAATWVRAVDGVSLQVEAGEAVGLVGPSGCGKSTLAALLARLSDADSGAIRFDGVDIATVPARRAASAPWRSRIQMVFQDPLDSLDPHQTVQQAIAAPLRRLGGLRGQALDLVARRVGAGRRAPAARPVPP